MSAPSLDRVLDPDGVLILAINRPHRRNALDEDTRSRLIEALDAASVDDAVRVVILTGRGGEAFASGADLEEHESLDPQVLERSLRGRRVYDAVGECARPVVAMIDGYCLGGGCELALSADIRVASRRSTFGQPEVRLGIIPGGGGTQRLPGAIGLGSAMRLVLTGDLVDADEARALGLIDLVTEVEDLESTVRDLAIRIARNSPRAVSLAKRALRASQSCSLEAGLQRERDLLGSAFATDDFREGVAAFRERRSPRFTGR